MITTNIDIKNPPPPFFVKNENFLTSRNLW